MKKCLLILFFALAGLIQVKAQDGDGSRLQALKIAFLTKKLNLTPEEAQKFWPIYNKYEDEIRAIRREQREKNTPQLDVEEKILGVRKKYNGEFGKALSVEKVNTFFKSEREFGAVIQRELQERRMNRRGLRE